MENVGLVKEMYRQLTTEFLKAEQNLYTVRVAFNGTVYYITGTYREWKGFFSMYPMAEPEG